MRARPFFLFDDDINAILASWRFLDPASRGALIVFGSIGLVTLLALFWALFLRKRHHRRHSHHHSHRHSSPPAESLPAPDPADAFGSTDRHRHSRRFRRSRHSRNPTLAETGGLPPVREEGPSEPLP